VSGRRLTIAQSAVYAALAVRGPSTLTQVAMAVGARSLSEAERVLASLARQGLVHAGGDADLVYADGVMYWLGAQVPPVKDCVECGRDMPHCADDYVCVVCRAETEVRLATAA
jgi:fumarylacetoacetate (FAA) hydrolase family protein